MKKTPGMDMTTRIKEDLQPRSKHYEPDIKIRILNLFESGNASSKVITESFGITLQTIYNWRKAYEKNGMAGLEDAPK